MIFFIGNHTAFSADFPVAFVIVLFVSVQTMSIFIGVAAYFASRQTSVWMVMFCLFDFAAAIRAT